MSITVPTRKLLWGRSGGRCAICRDELCDMTAGYDTIVGQEAHIISRRPGGPRGEFCSAETALDDYSNLILLCSRDHTIVDQQVGLWPVARLIETKRMHEEWVRTLPPEARPVKVLPGEDYGTAPISVMSDGEALWRILAGAHSFRFDRPRDATAEELDFLASLFDQMKDWGEMASFMHSLTEERDAEKSLGRLLGEIWAKGFVLTGRRATLVVTGGILPDSTWGQAELTPWRPAHLVEAFRTEAAEKE